MAQIRGVFWSYDLVDNVQEENDLRKDDSTTRTLKPAPAQVRGLQSPCKLTFLPPGGQNEVAEIRGVFLINTPIWKMLSAEQI